MSVCRRAVLLAVLLTLTATASASASTFLRFDPFGTTVPAGTALTSAVGDTVFVNISTIGLFTCFSSSLGVTVNASGGALVTGTLTSLTFTGCAAPFGCQKAPGTTVPLTLGTTDVVLHNLYIKCLVSATIGTCYYGTPLATGNVDNFQGASLRFNSGVNFSHTVPAGATDDAGAGCATTGSWATRGLTHLTATVGPSLTRVTVTPT